MFFMAPPPCEIIKNIFYCNTVLKNRVKNIIFLRIGHLDRFRGLLGTKKWQSPVA